jgi:hypothetical protein
VSDDLFDGPGSADTFKPVDHNGRLLLIKPKQLLAKVSTKDYGDKEAIEADIHILDGPEAGTVLRDGRVFGLVMLGQLKSNVGTGRFNLGRLGQGEATKGNPPWKLFDPTDADKELARRYLASDRYKQNNTAAAPTPAPAPAAPADDPWGSAPAPAAAAAPAADPWAGSEPPF